MMVRSEFDQAVDDVPKGGYGGWGISAWSASSAER